MLGNKKCFIIGDYIVNLWSEDGAYLNGLQYKHINEFGWIYSTPEEFYLEILSNNIKFVEVSTTDQNNKKIPKPKELKGIKHSFSDYYINKKSKYQVFVNGKDLWVSHNDYLSESVNCESGTPLSYRLKKFYAQAFFCKDKFVYADTWGDIVIRRKAWIKIENVLTDKYMKDISYTAKLITRLQEKSLSLDEFSLEDTDMSRMWENILNNVSKIK